MNPFVLLIDDDPDMAVVIEDALGDLGWSVQVATSPQQAQTLLATGAPPAFVLADSFSPSGHDPYVALASVRAATSAPIVICSAWPPTDFGDHRARGFAALLAKPFDLAALLALARAFWPDTCPTSPPTDQPPPGSQQGRP